MVAESYVLRAENVVKRFTTSGTSRRTVTAVDNVSLSISPSEIVGLVGESGSGKSTFARCMLRLVSVDEGRIYLSGNDITRLPPRKLKGHRRNMHIVFQDPAGSLNPKMNVGSIVSEPIIIHGMAPRYDALSQAAELLELVGLDPDVRTRYPHELSGGQRQRVAIARALSVRPSLLVADEAVSALDVSVQATILNLLVELQKQLGFACLFISHDLDVVRVVADRVAVMYAGELVEEAYADGLYTNPLHPYTELLLDSIPVPDPDVPFQGNATQRPAARVAEPDVAEMGCKFRDRCPLAEPACGEGRPPLVDLGTPGRPHFVRCFVRARELDVPVQIVALGDKEPEALPKEKGE